MIRLTRIGHATFAFCWREGAHDAVEMIAGDLRGLGLLDLTSPLSAWLRAIR